MKFVISMPTTTPLGNHHKRTSARVLQMQEYSVRECRRKTIESRSSHKLAMQKVKKKQLYTRRLWSSASTSDLDLEIRHERQESDSNN